MVTVLRPDVVWGPTRSKFAIVMKGAPDRVGSVTPVLRPSDYWIEAGIPIAEYHLKVVHAYGNLIG